MKTIKLENDNDVLTNGIVNGVINGDFKCLTVLPIGSYLIKTIDDALKFSDALWLHGEFDSFRDCVQFWLKATASRKGLDYVLKNTGLSKASYYRGVSSIQERKHSQFDNYLACLYPVQLVFDTMREQYVNTVLNGNKENKNGN